MLSFFVEVDWTQVARALGFGST